MDFLAIKLSFASFESLVKASSKSGFKALSLRTIWSLAIRILNAAMDTYLRIRPCKRKKMVKFGQPFVYNVHSVEKMKKYSQLKCQISLTEKLSMYFTVTK